MPFELRADADRCEQLAADGWEIEPADPWRFWGIYDHKPGPDYAAKRRRATA